MIRAKDDITHLGVLIGPTDSPRVIALGTSAVFQDLTLLRTYWDTDGSHLDSGVQAHLYTRAEDVFVAKIPAEEDAARRFGVALDVNHAIWRRLTGAELTSSASRILLVTGSDAWPPPRATPPPRMTWVQGTLQDAVAAAWRDSGATVLAFVLDAELIARLGVKDAELSRRAAVIARLMDKNDAMALLTADGVACARTYPFTASDGVVSQVSRLPAGPARYVVKPAGGAAGIGVFTDNGAGADHATTVRHVAGLHATGKLPSRFQVQEFRDGSVWGASLWLDGRGDCQIFEIHEQILDASARFAGARWTRSGHAAREAEVMRLGRAMSASVGMPLLVGIDFVQGVMLEVNPRITASAPIAHLLRHAADLEVTAGREIERIDIDTRMTIPYGAIASGRVADAVEAVQATFGTLVLPQGLNPFGSTRVVFVNDDQRRTARATFARWVR